MQPADKSYVAGPLKAEGLAIRLIRQKYYIGYTTDLQSLSFVCVVQIYKHACAFTIRSYSSLL